MGNRNSRRNKARGMPNVNPQEEIKEYIRTGEYSKLLEYELFESKAFESKVRNTNDSLINFLKTCTDFAIISHIIDNYKGGMSGIIDDVFTGNSFFHLACGYSTLEVVRYLVKNGANLELLSASSNKPIHYAAVSGKLEVVNYLIEKKVRLNDKNCFGFSPIDCAIQCNNIDVIKRLLTENIDINENTFSSYNLRNNKVLNKFDKEFLKQMGYHFRMERDKDDRKLREVARQNATEFMKEHYSEIIN